MPTDTHDTLLTAEEVGRILRLKPATVYEAAASGRIPSVRLWRGQRKALVRFRRDDIEELIRDRTHRGSQGAS
ncbi:MAG: helix-turn-helix domain-containing protein [bacterium]|nr:helix-turn-helix domain-containing protein [bacterium]